MASDPVENQEVDSAGESPPADGNRLHFHVPIKTLGGRQFWGDRYHFQGWRIQQNVFVPSSQNAATESSRSEQSHRLLDPNDYRYASGSYETCLAKLNEIRQQHSLPNMPKRVILTVHGITRSSKFFSKMAREFRQRGETVLGFDYPSTRVNIAVSANYLHETLQSLEGVETIDLVVHSMGGLVVRYYLQDHHDPRLHRMVMLGTPNRGSEMANILKNNSLFKVIFGPAGQELVVNPQGGVLELPLPDFEFAVIAGNRGTPNGYNPLIPGDDDGLVSVASTRLPGARDFMTVRSLHSFMSSHPDVIEATYCFLENGALRASGERHPVETVNNE